MADRFVFKISAFVTGEFNSS